MRRRVYKATWNISPHFVLNYRLMLIVLRTGFSSKLNVFFSFGFNEVLLAEASLTWWERCQTDERCAAWFKTKPWALLKNNKTYFTCSLSVHLFSTLRLSFIYVSLENLVFSRPVLDPANNYFGGEIIRGWEVRRFHASQVFSKGRHNSSWDTSGSFSGSVLGHNTAGIQHLVSFQRICLYYRVFCVFLDYFIFGCVGSSLLHAGFP